MISPVFHADQMFLKCFQVTRVNKSMGSAARGTA